MPHFVILVEFTLAPDRVEDFFAAVCINAAASARDEPGCRKFDVLRDIADPARANVVTLYEIYDDEAAFDAHLKTPHFAAFAKAIEGMETGPRALRRLHVWEDGRTA
ncbi:MAG: putative quinol monooxygenase [Alphaproteobacteria bacterium]